MDGIPVVGLITRQFALVERVKPAHKMPDRNLGGRSQIEKISWVLTAIEIDPRTFGGLKEGGQIAVKKSFP